MNKIRGMEIFKLIVEEGNIVSAAKKLNITKAAASKQLIELETALNTQLFNRTTRAIHLTDVGREFYEATKRVFAAISDAEEVVSQIHKTPVGILRVTSHRHFGEKYILNNLKEFTSLYPHLKLDLELADRFPDLEKENIDVLCGISHDGPDHLVRRRIASTCHIMCASPEYIAEHGLPKIPKDLKNHRYITHSFRNPDNVLLFKDQKELHLDYFIRVNDAQAMLHCALQGLGVIKIHNYFVENLIEQGKLIEILSKFREPEKSIYIYFQQQKFIQPKVRLFLDFLYKKIDTI